MGKLTEADREKAQELMREVVVILGSVNEVEKTLSRVRNETTELYKKLDIVLNEKVGDESGSEA